MSGKPVEYIDPTGLIMNPQLWEGGSVGDHSVVNSADWGAYQFGAELSKLGMDLNLDWERGFRSFEGHMSTANGELKYMSSNFIYQSDSYGSLGTPGSFSYENMSINDNGSPNLNYEGPDYIFNQIDYPDITIATGAVAPTNDEGMVIAGAQVLAKAGTGAGAVLTKKAVHKHHSFPKFMGGAVKQKLTKMPVEAHKQLHKDLYSFLKDKYPGMVPHSQNPGYAIQRNFPKNQRIQAMKDFYTGPGAKYVDAVVDFFKQIID